MREVLNARAEVMRCGLGCQLGERPGVVLSFLLRDSGRRAGGFEVWGWRESGWPPEAQSSSSLPRNSYRASLRTARSSI